MVLIATDCLSLRKLPNAQRILPIVPARNKQIQEKLEPQPALSEVERE